MITIKKLSAYDLEPGDNFYCQGKLYRKLKPQSQDYSQIAIDFDNSAIVDCSNFENISREKTPKKMYVQVPDNRYILWDEKLYYKKSNGAYSLEDFTPYAIADNRIVEIVDVEIKVLVS